MQVFIKRPVMALAVNLVLVIIGIVAWQSLPMRHKPESPKHQIQITTSYPGANYKVVEQRITKLFEDALSGLDGIKRMTSNSQDGYSDISITLNAGVDPDRATANIRDKLQSRFDELPESAKKPDLNQMAEHEMNIMYIAYQDSVRSINDVYDYVNRNIVDQIKLIEGVASVGLYGGTPYQIELQLDAADLAQHQITMTELLARLKREKMFGTGGEIDTQWGKKTLIIDAGFATVEDLGKISIKTAGSQIVTLGDIAKIRLIPTEVDMDIQIDNEKLVSMSLTAKPSANPIEVAKRVHVFIDGIQASLPKTMRAEVIYDATHTFVEGINNVYHSIWEAIVLVAVIVTISLASLRAAIIPIITIPLCLVSAFTVMHWLDFSINPITLLAMVLAVGLVVDDAIVVVENIHRHMEKGGSALSAAASAMKEITFAVVVMTLTLAAVYMPIAFQPDESARMFREFAWTLAGCVLVSGFVALTLIPAISGRLLSNSQFSNSNNKAEQIWHAMQSSYKNLLISVMYRPILVMLVILTIGFIGYKLYAKLPAEMTPYEDKDTINGYLVVDNVVPENLRAEWRDKVRDYLFKAVPERNQLYVGRWREFDWWFMTLKPRKERERGSDKILDALEPGLGKLHGPLYGVQREQLGTSLSKGSLDVLVKMTGDGDYLLQSVEKTLQALMQIPGVTYANSEEAKRLPRYKIKLDRELAAELGVMVDDIEQTLYTLLTGSKVFDYTFNNHEYYVYIRAPKQSRQELGNINEFFVSGFNGVQIPLGTVVNIEQVSQPKVAHHEDRIPAVQLHINLSDELKLADAMRVVEPVLKANLPQDAQFMFSGAAKEFEETRQALWITFALALAFIFLVLAALFESFVDPFIVLCTVPLSIVGAIAAISIFHGTNNVYLQIGLVTLVGLITKHGVLITDFANRLQNQGQELKEAVINAAASRLRPILMTTMAMICGAIPLVISLGYGANARAHIGWVIIGGMITGTLLSLFVIPLIYYWLGRFRGRVVSR